MTANKLHAERIELSKKCSGCSEDCNVCMVNARFNAIMCELMKFPVESR